MVHAKSCKAKVTKSPSSTQKLSMEKPKAVMCHMCGMEFGTTSIAIHFPQCKQKLQQQHFHIAAPPKAVLPQPTDPNYLQLLKEYNDEAYEIYMQRARRECSKCGRKIAPDRFEAHQRACNKGGPAEDAEPVKITSRPTMYICYVCCSKNILHIRFVARNTDPKVYRFIKSNAWKCLQSSKSNYPNTCKNHYQNQ